MSQSENSLRASPKILGWVPPRSANAQAWFDGSVCMPLPGLPLRTEIRPDVSASLAAGRTDELVFDVRNAQLIRPAISVVRHRDAMAAAIVGAIDQQAAHAALAHLGEGDLLWGRRARACGHDCADGARSEAARGCGMSRE